MPERKAPRKLSATELFDYALKLLGARAQSTSELRQKLLRRAEPDVDFDPIFAKLREYGYLNDRKFAETFAAARRDNQGFGKMRVLRDLQRRRVAPKLAETTVTAAYAEVDETKQIEEYLARKFRTINLPEYLQNEKKLASVYRRLRGAGFSSGAAVKVLFRYAKSAASLGEDDAPEEVE